MLEILFIIFSLLLGVFFFFYLKEEKKAKKLKRYSSCEEKKGIEFERDIINEIKKSQPKAKILTNIIIPNGVKGGTTEIDVLVLTEKGFYCLECKNYSGLVVGKPEDKKWTIFYNKDYKKTFYSPIEQNKRHIMCLRKMFPKFYFHNIVVFSNTTKLSDVLWKNKDVMTFNGFKWFISKGLSNKKSIETESVVESVYDYLKKFENKGRDTHIEYVKRVQKVANL